MLTQQQLMQTMRYEPDTGKFFRLVDKRSGKPGKETGTLRKDGYVMVKVSTGSRTYRAHQLAFLYMTGDIPATVDHINGIKSDNRWDNLRASTHGENMQNQRGAHTGSKSGLLGVSWHKSARKWQAQIKIAKVRHYLGRFTDKHEAHQAYLKAKAELHPFSTI